MLSESLAGLILLYLKLFQGAWQLCLSVTNRPLRLLGLTFIALLGALLLVSLPLVAVLLTRLLV